MPSAFFQTGVARLQQGDAKGGLHFLKRVVELEPTYTRAWCQLGRAHLALGQTEEALRAWKRGPYDPDCLEAHGRHLLPTDPVAAAPLFRTLSIRTGADPAVGLLLATALAERAPGEAADLIGSYLELRHDDHPDLLPAVEAVVAASDDHAAQALVEWVQTKFPSLADPLVAKMEIREVDARARELMGAAPVRLSSEQRRVLSEARAHFAAGDVTEALVLTESLADGAARSPEVWASLGDLREASGDIAGAERALWLARRLDPLDAAVQVRHAELLQEHFAGRYATEAFEALDRAVEVRPTPALREQHARLALQIGRVVAARQSLSWLAEHGSDAAQIQLDGLDRVRANPPSLRALAAPDGVGEEAWLHTHRAQVWWERARQSTPVDGGRLEHAVGEIDAALLLEPGLLKARNLRAQIRWTAGDAAAAKRDWRASLEQRPEQPTVLVRLSELLRQEGEIEEADVLLDRAAGVGSGVALFRLAQRDAGQRRWLSALERLDAYFSQASSGPVYDEAVKLKAELEWKLIRLGVAAVGMVLVMLLLPVLLWRRRRAGIGVVDWLKREPRSYGDVARIVSAIRHEVLKHNISSLPMVADALEDGDDETVSWAADRLGVALEQLDRYLGELRSRARSQGVQLNLERRDPVFGPFLASVDRLRRLRTRMKPKNAAELRQISEELNDTAFRDLGRLVDGVCVLQLSGDLFQSAWSEVCSEPTAVGRTLPRFDAEVESLRVRMFRQDLVDVLVNLLRNALAASIEESRDALSVRVCTDEDPITGLLRAEIRVCDQVKKRFTTAMIRGRYIDRGLGLAVDLVSRAGGSVHVEEEAGWAKAVVVRLPMEHA